MELDDFLQELHFAPHKDNLPNWEVNWDDAPLPFKLYRRLPTFELSHEVPFTIPGPDTNFAQPKLSDIGHFLWYTFGLSQLSHFIEVGLLPEEEAKVSTAYRRFVPSGGGLYPSELYMYLKIEELPSGIYHYDVAHHRLVLLREGEADEYLGEAVAHYCELSTCFATVFISTLFWKNFFKYHNFSYRLQGLDAGAVIGQLRAVADRFGFAVEVCFQFLDRAVNHLLGLNAQEESVYAVIPLWLESGNTQVETSALRERTQSATELCKWIPEIQTEYHIGSRTVKEYPMLVKLNEASFRETARSLRSSTSHEIPLLPVGKGNQTVTLPNVQGLSYDLLSVCQNRHSPGMNFIHSNMNQRQLASLLYETTSAALHKNERYGKYGENDACVSLYVSLHGIDGIPDGAYQYDSARHQLRLIRSGDQRGTLQSGMSMNTVGMFHVPNCVHLAGARNPKKTHSGTGGIASSICRPESCFNIYCCLLPRWA